MILTLLSPGLLVFIPCFFLSAALLFLPPACMNSSRFETSYVYANRSSIFFRPVHLLISAAQSKSCMARRSTASAPLVALH